MQGIISRNGDIKDLKVISGDDLLVASAVKAVSQWKYRPYLLQGQPVEVETCVTVDYRLTR
jgi:protein TonB